MDSSENNIDEKKWFIYLGDHHEGPFSVVEVKSRMAEGLVTAANYVWCDGMGDWQLMSEVGAFAALAQPMMQQAAAGGMGSAASFFKEAEPSLQAVDDPFPASVSPIEPLAVAEPAIEMPASASAVPVTVFGGDMTEAVASDPGSSFIEAPSASVAAEAVVVPFNSIPAEGGTGPFGRAEVAAAASLELQKHPEIPGGSHNDARPPQVRAEDVPVKKRRFRRFLRALRPVFMILVVAGIVFAYTAGYMDPVLTNPAVRAFTNTVADASRPYLIQFAEKVPAFRKLISPIPRPDDVSEAQYAQLREAAMAGPQNVGIKLALVLSTDSAHGPVFYSSGNVPDGTKVEVRIVGVADTLLNQLSARGTESLTFSKRLGKTAPMHGADGKPVPKGQYDVYLVESADDLPAGKTALLTAAAIEPLANVPAPPPEVLPQGAKLLATSSEFLGGLKDDTYASRLKEFHAKLSKRAIDELRELRQFSETLQSQLDETRRKFDELKKSLHGGKFSPVSLKNWGAFDQRWTQLSSSLNQSFAKWTPEILEQEYYYGMLYQLTQQAGQAVDLLHKTQQSYALPGADHTSLDMQLAQAEPLAATTVTNLQGKIDQAEKIPPSANGMPRRDGL